MLEGYEKEKAAIAAVRPSLSSSPCSHSASDVPNPLLSCMQETEKKKAGAERFVTHIESLDEKLKKSTVGLVNLKDFQEKRKALEIEQAIAGAQIPVK
jgi:hypothetical protein